MSVVINGTTGIVNNATDLNYTGTLTGGTGVVNLGSGQFYKDASGNVGIGTSSPGAKLQVTGGYSTLGDFNAGTTGASPQALGVSFSNNITNGQAESNIWNGFDPATYVNTGILFCQRLTASTRRDLMFLHNTGNVGIGTNSPAYKVEANITVAATSGVQDVAMFRAFSSGNTDSTFGARLLLGTKNPNGNSWPAGIAAINDAGGSNLSSLGFYTATAGPTLNERMRIDSSGGLILAGSTAQKATGTTWSNPSDQRLKDNIRDYVKGTTELMQVRVREWEYNGKGGTIEGTKGLGVVADEVMVVLPDTVENYETKLNSDDEETTEIKKFDATEITWLLVKTAQEQQALITALTTRITALEGTP